MIYELTKELETGNATIDSEHKQLFDAVNALMDACSQGKGRAALKPTVEFFLDYVNRHFAHEEQLQKSSGYPNMEAHVKFHRGYTAKLREIAEEILSHETTVLDLSKFNAHIAVLVSHIKTEDRKLGASLRAQ